MQRRWSEINLGVITIEPLLPFLDESRVQSQPRCLQEERSHDLSSRCPRKRSLHRSLGRPTTDSLSGALLPSLLPLPARTHLSPKVTPSVRPFPFTLPNARLPIPGPQSCTSNGDKYAVDSPNKMICQCPSSTPCYESGPASIVRELAYSNGRVYSLSISITTPCANAQRHG